MAQPSRATTSEDVASMELLLCNLHSSRFDTKEIGILGFWERQTRLRVSSGAINDPRCVSSSRRMVELKTIPLRSFTRTATAVRDASSGRARAHLRTVQWIMPEGSLVGRKTSSSNDSPSAASAFIGR